MLLKSMTNPQGQLFPLLLRMVPLRLTEGHELRAAFLYSVSSMVVQEETLKRKPPTYPPHTQHTRKMVRPYYIFHVEHRAWKGTNQK